MRLGTLSVAGRCIRCFTPLTLDAHISLSVFAAAAMEADQPDTKSDIEEEQEEIMDDDEAAEILEAMLGLAPAVQPAEPAKKRRKGTSRVSSYS